MIGDTKTIQLKDSAGTEKDYTIRKCGVSKSMELQGIFLYLVQKSNISYDANTDDEAFISALQIGLDEYSIRTIKKIVIDLCSAPRFDDESFEELSINTVFGLFINLYLFNVHEGLKKKSI